jgi:hypothetical protein
VTGTEVLISSDSHARLGHDRIKAHLRRTYHDD